MKYRKILTKYNAYFKKAVFHSRENIKSCISQPWKYKLYFTAVKLDVLCFLHWLPWAHFRFLNTCNFLISGQKHKVWVYIFLVRSQGNFCQDLLKFSLFPLMLLWFQFLLKNLSGLKLYIIKRRFKFLEWICHLFHQVKRKMHILWVEATHEICIFLFTQWNKWYIHSKNLNILYIWTWTFTYFWYSYKTFSKNLTILSTIAFRIPLTFVISYTCTYIPVVSSIEGGVYK